MRLVHKYGWNKNEKRECIFVFFLLSLNKPQHSQTFFFKLKIIRMNNNKNIEKYKNEELEKCK